ncbi:hypothetical protein TNCV_1377161 [Trichonephila clavipes]|nr:hypothetical protein TNCV_1377161 [Trichonephila clavipes]
MAYRCDPCNLDFPDFEHYFRHDCKFNDEQLLSQESNDNSMCRNTFLKLKTSKESHKSNVLGIASSKRNGRALDSVKRPKIVSEDPKLRNNKRLFQRDVNIALKTQIERDNQNKMSASNSFLMKYFNVYSKTPSEQNILGRSLNNKNNEIEVDPKDKKTNRNGSVEENLKGDSSSSHLRTDTGEEMKVRGTIENSINVKPILMKTLQPFRRKA